MLVSRLCKSKPKLESLGILLHWFNSNGGVLEIVKKLCRSFPHLKALCLKFENPDLTLWRLENENHIENSDDEEYDEYAEYERYELQETKKHQEIVSTMVDIANTVQHRLTELEDLRFVIRGITDIYQQLNPILNPIGTKITSLKGLAIEFSKLNLAPYFLLRSFTETSFSDSLPNLKRFTFRVAKGVNQKYTKSSRIVPILRTKEEIEKEKRKVDTYIGVIGRKMAGLFTQLEHFIFEFPGCEITDEGFIEFISNIQSGSPIKHLTLNLEGWSLTDQSLEVLGPKISEDLVNLESLILDFTDNCDITCEGVEKFITHCQTRDKLKEFTLILYSCGEIKKKDVKRFKKMLKFIPDLDILV